MKDRIYLKVCEYARKTGIADKIGNAEAVAVGFSGGADSAFLLAFLNKYLKGVKLYACHLNHMIRGDEATRDNEFAKEFCAERNITFIEEKIDVLSIAEKEKLGTEECARNIRYAFFDRCRNKIANEISVNVEKVFTVTAHNADDNLETVVFNLVRGSGTRGIGGISPVRGQYLRPLLCLDSEEIREYCKSNGILYVTDSTNESDDYTRNLIRHSVTPILKKINPRAAENVLSASNFAREDDGALNELAKKFIYENGFAPKREKLASLCRPVLARVLKAMYEKESTADVSRASFASASELIASASNGKVAFPNGVTLFVGEKVYYSRVSPESTVKAKEYSLRLDGGICECLDGKYIIGISDNIGLLRSTVGNFYNSLITVPVNNDKIKGTLYARNRREGDVYLLRGHHRKVKKILCEKKIPVKLRDEIPFICGDDGILWIPSFEPRDGVGAKGTGDVFFVFGYNSENGCRDGGKNGKR